MNCPPGQPASRRRRGFSGVTTMMAITIMVFIMIIIFVVSLRKRGELLINRLPAGGHEMMATPTAVTARTRRIDG